MGPILTGVMILIITINCSLALAVGATGGSYPVHTNVTTTYFWVGEGASADNNYISNSPSAWDELWQQHYGGVDDPNHRNGYYPAKFKPKENPFYFALPYNDFDGNGNRKINANKVYWWGSKKWGALESCCKNQWIKITKGSKIVYAQWEDVGPYGEDDAGLVFGTAPSKSMGSNNGRLDVSPAVRDYLGLDDMDKVSWQFVDAGSVPAGPWKNIITTSQIYWR
ncbi:MAG: hypothetical protein A2W01_03540 [Candidatus Solincola sediminis]|uniref:Uncharacterized protein n=1 Tax=Candidatus Solincola sediminis TaxID=1797199 RepID=A0A1F2WRR5_9ACTN|nr:MAG: hypothetical protein A2Y75_11595 [Candidatus Solincola sediminis]OFW60395.1 MAG: hypothetical protein A2W01_03540 [Candidatus Solincola sediminis]